jgi:hypothetical protein
MKKLIFGIVPAILTAAYATASFAGVCENLAADIEWQVKSIALTHSESVNTVHQQTNKLLTIGNHQRLMQMNLELMAQHKCTPLTEVPSYVSYLKPALDCQIALLSGKKDDPACDMKNWKPMEKSDK